MAGSSSNLSFEFSADSKTEIRNIFQDLAKEVVSEVMQNPIERKAYLNKREACVYLGVSFLTLQKLIMMGCPVIQIDNKHLLSKASIDSFMKSLENK